jgi:hypothetical protein
MRLAFDLTSMCRVVFHKAALVKSSGPVTGCQVLVFEEGLVTYEPLIPEPASPKLPIGLPAGGGKSMKSFQILGQPSLFDDVCEGENRKPDVNTSQSTLKENIALGSQASHISRAPRISQDPSRPAISGPKRRKTYQRGTLGSRAPEARSASLDLSLLRDG